MFFCVIFMNIKKIIHWIIFNKVEYLTKLSVFVCYFILRKLFFLVFCSGFVFF